MSTKDYNQLLPELAGRPWGYLRFGGGDALPWSFHHAFQSMMVVASGLGSTPILSSLRLSGPEVVALRDGE